MEIDEVLARVLRRYWALLLVCVMVPLGVVAALIIGQPPVYAAHARIVTGSVVPSSSAEADGIVSQVRALATSRGTVVAAIASTHASRSVKDFTDRQINVTGLGTSQIVDLTVTDHDPRVAQRADATLAREVVNALNKVGDGGLTKTLGAIDEQLLTLVQRRASLAATVQKNAKDQVAQNKLSGIQQMITDLTTSRSELVTRAAAEGRAVVVEVPVLPNQPEPNGLAQKLALAGLLGLVVGVLLAALGETLWPTVPGAARVARRLGAPVLGTLGPEELSGRRTARLHDLVRSLRLAARHAGVPTVVVAEASSSRTTEDVMALLEAVVPARAEAGRRLGVTDIESGRGPDGAPALHRVCRLRSVDPVVETDSVGLVVLAGPSTRLRDVTALRDLQDASGWPLLGIVGTPRHRRSRFRPTRGAPTHQARPPVAPVSDEPTDAYPGASTEGSAR